MRWILKLNSQTRQSSNELQYQQNNHQTKSTTTWIEKTKTSKIILNEQKENHKRGNSSSDERRRCNRHPGTRKQVPRWSKMEGIPVLISTLFSRFRRWCSSSTWCRRWCCSSTLRWLGFGLHHHPDNQPLAGFAVTGLPADEVEESEVIECENRVSVFEFGDWVWCDAVFVIFFVHYQHWVLLVLEYWKQTVRQETSKIKVDEKTVMALFGICL